MLLKPISSVMKETLFIKWISFKYANGKKITIARIRGKRKT